MSVIAPSLITLLNTNGNAVNIQHACSNNNNVTLCNKIKRHEKNQTSEVEPSFNTYAGHKVFSSACVCVLNRCGLSFVGCTLCS